MSIIFWVIKIHLLFGFLTFLLSLYIDYRSRKLSIPDFNHLVLRLFILLGLGVLGFYSTVDMFIKGDF